MMDVDEQDHPFPCLVPRQFALDQTFQARHVGVEMKTQELNLDSAVLEGDRDEMSELHVFEQHIGHETLMLRRLMTSWQHDIFFYLIKQFSTFILAT